MAKSEITLMKQHLEEVVKGWQVIGTTETEMRRLCERVIDKVYRGH